MKNNQDGFSVVETLLVIVVIGLIGAVGWLIYDRQKSMTDDKQANTQVSQQTGKSAEKAKSSDPYEGWESGSFKYTKLTYKLPPGWKDISDNTKFQDGYTKYEEIKIKANDGFELWMSVNNLPRGYEGAPLHEVLDFKNINGNHQWIIADRTDNKIDSIYVGSGVKSIGEKIYPVANVGRDGLNIEIIGSYDTAVNTLNEFNDKQSVKDAKLVFESLKF